MAIIVLQNYDFFTKSQNFMAFYILCRKFAIPPLFDKCFQQPCELLHFIVAEVLQIRIIFHVVFEHLRHFCKVLGVLPAFN